MNKITVTEKEMKNPQATIYALKMSRNQLKANNRELKCELRELKEVARHSGGKINILGEKSTRHYVNQICYWLEVRALIAQENPTSQP